MKITFLGHSVISFSEHIKEALKVQIQNTIVDSEKIVTCYLGGYGDFDRLCALVCKELKKKFPNIELVYVTPYLSISEQEKIKNMQKCGLCDTSIYPPIENVPLRFAISKRNEWMITNSDLIIAYVHRSYGGAYNSLKIAKQKKKKVINIYDLIM